MKTSKEKQLQITLLKEKLEKLTGKKVKFEASTPLRKDPARVKVLYVFKHEENGGPVGASAALKKLETSLAKKFTITATAAHLDAGETGKWYYLDLSQQPQLQDPTKLCKVFKGASIVIYLNKYYYPKRDQSNG